MDLASVITVIAPTTEALARVTTPFVAFEHSFQDRIARFERQLEAFTRYMPVIMLGDTWPDSYHDSLTWIRSAEAAKAYRYPQERWQLNLWPETAVYSTAVARILGVNDHVRYRPQMWTFCQFYEECRAEWHQDIEVLAEGVIHVENRSIYPAAYPKLTLRPEERLLTIIIFGQQDTVAAAWPKDAEIIELGQEPSGAAFNQAVEQATGRFVALCQPGDANVTYRFTEQIKDDVDLSFSRVYDSGQMAGWELRGYTHKADTPTAQLGTMMFKRSLFERLPGAHPELQSGFDYDLFVRLAADHSIDIVYRNEALVQNTLQLPYGRIYTQQVYNDVANRVRYGVDYHANSIRRRPLDECLLARSGSEALMRERARRIAEASKARL